MNGSFFRVKSLLALTVSLAVFLPPTDTFAQAGVQKVSQVEIRHVGPAAVSESLIRANIRVKEGDNYSRISVDEDVRNLYSTHFFYNIRVSESATPDGLIVTYVLQGNPILTDVNVVGNKKFSRSKILKKSSAKVGEPLNEPNLFKDTQEMQKMYQKAGMQKSEVKYLLNVDENSGRATVTYEIAESPKVKIEAVAFEGSSAFSEKKLRKVIKTRRRWWMSWLTGSGVLKDDQLEDDKDKLADFYRNSGYIDFEIKDVAFDSVKENRMIVRFDVFEGKQYKVGNIEFKNNKLFATEDLKALLKMNEGETYTPRGLTRDREQIEDYYGARGYIGEADASRIQVRSIRQANIENSSMDLLYEVEEGEKSYIERIEIRGNTKTKDRVLRRELLVAPGEVFDMVKVKASRDRLSQLEYFSKVDAAPEPTDVPNRKDLVVAVEETSTGDINFGAGFSSVDSVIGFVGVNQGNFDLFNPPYFTGAGQKFRLQATVGTLRQDYELGFTEPWLFGRKLQFNVDLFHREADYLSDVYSETRTGMKLGLRRALLERTYNGVPQTLAAGVNYTIERVELDFDTRAPRVFTKESLAIDPTGLDEEGGRLVSKVGFTLDFDTQRDPLRDSAGRPINLPRRGQFTEFRTDFAGGPFGGDSDFYTVELRSAWYFPGFAEGHVVEVRGRSGVVDNFGGSDKVPLFDRWFLGGANSLRGFDFRDVGPKVADVDPGEPRGGNLDEAYGGSTYYFGSLEYSLPIVDRLRFALFYDIGNVYLDPYDFDISEYNDNWGIGLRINITPRMPLRLDYGIPITTDRFNDSGGRFNFSVGYKLRN